MDCITFLQIDNKKIQKKKILITEIIPSLE